MSKTRVAAATVLATSAIAATSLVSAPSASAASVCTTPQSISCSKHWAWKTTQSGAQYGKHNAQVVALQNALRQAGRPVRVSGTFDGQTRTYLISYQWHRNLKTTGVLDYATISALRAGKGDLHPSVTASALPRRELAVSFAVAQSGKSYVYGATGPDHFDCSGLVYAAYRATGKTLARTSYAQLRSYPSVSRSQLRPGDIVGFYGGGHVGIYIGAGLVVHSPHTGDVVKISSLSSMGFYKAVRPA